jgi:hypothetical protein
MKGWLDAHRRQRRCNRRLDDDAAQLETSFISPTLFTVAARSVGGQAHRSKTTPANKRNGITNALTRWNRLKDLEAFQHGLDSLLG